MENWERVSYGKKKDKLNKHDKKKINENMLRVEDLDHVARSSIYLAGGEGLDLAAYAEANGAGGASRSNGAGNQGSPAKARQQQQSSGSKTQSSNGGSAKRPPANNTEALQAVSPARLERALEQSRNTIPDSPLAWLVDICAIIDLDMVYDKKEDWTRTDLNFPSNNLPNASRQLLNRLLESVSDEVKRRFYLHACQRLVKQSEKPGWRLRHPSRAAAAVRLLPQLPGHADCRQRMRELFDSARGTRAAFAALMWALGQTAYKCSSTALCLPAMANSWPPGGGRARPAGHPGRAHSRPGRRLHQAVAATRRRPARRRRLAGPGQTRDRLQRCLARLRPAWQRLAASASPEPDACARLLAALRRWDTAAPPGDLPWQCLMDSLRAGPPDLLANLPFSPEAASDLRLLREALDTNCGKDGEGAFGRAARLSLPRIRRRFPSDIVKMAAAGAAEAAAASLSSRSGRRRGGNGICGFVGRVLLRLMRLASLLLLVAMVTASVLCALAFVPRGQMPSFVRDYLEDRLVLYHVRRLHSECPQHLAELLRLWDRLADVYHDSLLPKCRQVGQAWREHAQPRLAAAWAAWLHFYREQALPWMTAVWLTARNGVVDAWQYAEL
uniref:Transmembrane protein n=1 Tax=Macrostomum lignano TaxID=282301 RepID=A0A1I8INW1_9PLAT